MCIYHARTTGYLNINHPLKYVKGIKNTEKKLCENDTKRRKKINKKWKNVLKYNWMLFLVKLHLDKNEVDLGSLQPLGWEFLR